MSHETALDLARRDSNEPIALARSGYTRDQVELIKRTIAEGASDDELQLFLARARTTGLDPFAKQIYAIFRWNGEAKRKVMTIQVGIDGLRLIAERSERYGGQVGPYWCGPDGTWRDIWLADEPPMAARVGIVRTDWREPLYAVARYSSYCQKDREGNPSGLWRTMPDVMIAKVAEALAIRRAFPERTAGLYTDDEMAQADNVETASPPPRTVVAQSPAVEMATKPQLEEIGSLYRRLGWPEEAMRSALQRHGAQKRTDLTRQQAAALIREMQTTAPRRTEPAPAAQPAPRVVDESPDEALPIDGEYAEVVEVAPAQVHDDVLIVFERVIHLLDEARNGDDVANAMAEIPHIAEHLDKARQQEMNDAVGSARVRLGLLTKGRRP